MLENFKAGGWPMFPILFCGVLLVAVAARYAMKPDPRWVPLQIALGILTLCTGALGFVLGLIMTTTYLGGVEPARVVQIGAIGFGESLNNLGLALSLMAIAAVASCVGAARQTRDPAVVR